MRSTVFRWARLAAAPVTLAVVVWRLGAGPFLDGVRAVDARALLAATVIGLVTTVCCAWRWTIVARGLGVRLSLPAAVAAYYRSLFLNVTLPGGVVGDVHRGVRLGGLRAVVWERGAGQLVQAVLTIAVLLVLPSPVRSSMPLVAVAAVATAVVAVRVARTRLSWLRGKEFAAIALASALVVLGHAVTFVIAARTAGVTAPTARLLPLALLALLAMVLPSVAGWGPREGATAWVFAAAGLGADRGVATSVAYGVMVLVACLPGAIVLVAAWLPRRRSQLRLGVVRDA
jgi:hypothetical protein